MTISAPSVVAVAQCAAALALALPAYRASRTLRHLQRLRDSAPEGEALTDLRERLLRSGKVRQNRWRPVDHAALVFGLCALVFSTVLQLWVLHFS